MSDQYHEFSCDVCGSDDAVEIPVARHYTGDRPIHVCRSCGFVYVRQRRSAEAIAADWSDRLYGGHYQPRIPAVRARQLFVAEFIDTTLGLAGKRVCDIGAGQGYFLATIAKEPFGAEVFGIEPSQANGKLLGNLGIEHFVGTIEDYVGSPGARSGAFDVVTIMWTLENCQSCRGMLDGAARLVKPGGHVVVATGSRILVPFKKPLQYYLVGGEQDTNCFRFSRNSLTAALANSGLEVVHGNRDVDHDVLCLVGRKTDAPVERPTDDWREVIDFFERWHRETQDYYADR